MPNTATTGAREGRGVAEHGLSIWANREVLLQHTFAQGLERALNLVPIWRTVKARHLWVPLSVSQKALHDCEVNCS